MGKPSSQTEFETKYITVITGLVLRQINSQPHILLTLRHEPECPDAHLKWELPGGKVQINETIPEALMREIAEETGVKAKPIKLLQNPLTSLWQYKNHQQYTLIFTYLCKYESGEISTSDHHVKSAQWHPLSKVAKLSTLPGTKEALEELRKDWGD